MYKDENSVLPAAERSHVPCENNDRTFGPTPNEAAHAFYVAADADAILDAMLEGNITSAHIRNLSVSLHELRMRIIGGVSFNERGEDLSMLDWSTSAMDFANPLQPRLVMEDGVLDA